LIAASTAERATPIRVLIVEDELILAQDLALTLESKGYKTTALVKSGEEAIASAEADPPDVVLMDVMLQGGMDGIEASAAIAERVDVPTIYLTAYADEKIVARARKTSPFGYLVKPINETELSIMIEMAVYKHQTERALLDQGRLLQSLLSAVNHPLLLVRASDYTVEMANAALGPRPEGTTCHRILRNCARPCPECGAEPLECPVQAVIQTGAPVTMEHEMLVGGTMRLHEVHAYPLLDAKGLVKSVLLYCVDISERKELELRARKAERMESIGRLARGVAHDFNNIMSAVIGLCEMTRMELPADSQAARKLGQALEAADRAAQLIEQLMTFSSSKEVAPTPIQPGRVIRGFLAVLAPLVPPEITFTTTTEGSAATVMADRVQFEQVILNLVVNARDAIKGEGRIELAAEDVDVGAEDAAMLGIRPGQYVATTVTDTGVGMPEDVRAHIFEPFFTTKPKGTGLGLATTYGIVRQHRGNIQVQSTPGSGTRITVYLPQATEQDA
jgi:hypothetical protein